MGIWFLLSGRREIAEAFFSYVLRVSNVVVECKGRLAEGSYLIMANHESYFDVPALVACFGQRLIWFARSGLFRIPIFGKALKKSGAIAVERNDPRRAAFAILRSLKLSADASMVIFPQGTRWGYGRFERGGIVIAKKRKMKIVPVRIEGSKRVMAPGSLRINPGKIVVRIFEPIDPSGLSDDEIESKIRSFIYP